MSLETFFNNYHVHLSKTLIEFVTSLRLKGIVVNFERALKMKKITVALRPKNNKLLDVKESKLKKIGT